MPSSAAASDGLQLSAASNIHYLLHFAILVSILRIHGKWNFLIILAAFHPLLSGASETEITPDSVVERYWAASENQERVLHGATMDVDIDASLPNLKKHGRLRALRRISSFGRITYEALRFEGDNTVKKDVIGRYLTAEAQAQSDGAPSLAVTPVNYKFKYRGVQRHESGTAHVFQVTPKRKQIGLFKGEIWIDADTNLLVRESGRLVKNPSIFLKSVEFVKEYEIQSGISVLRQVRTVVATRLVGPAELNIAYRNVLFAQGPKHAGLLNLSDQ